MEQTHRPPYGSHSSECVALTKPDNDTDRTSCQTRPQRPDTPRVHEVFYDTEEDDSSPVDIEENHCLFWNEDTPPQSTPNWRSSFSALRKQWSECSRNGSLDSIPRMAEERSEEDAIQSLVSDQRQGSEDHFQPGVPSPGEIRQMFGTGRVSEVPEYALNGIRRDPLSWGNATEWEEMRWQDLEAWNLAVEPRESDPPLELPTFGTNQNRANVTVCQDLLPQLSQDLPELIRPKHSIAVPSVDLDTVLQISPKTFPRKRRRMKKTKKQREGMAGDDVTKKVTTEPDPSPCTTFYVSSEHSVITSESESSEYHLNGELSKPSCEEQTLVSSASEVNFASQEDKGNTSTSKIILNKSQTMVPSATRTNIESQEDTGETATLENTPGKSINMEIPPVGTTKTLCSRRKKKKGRLTVLDMDTSEIETVVRSVFVRVGIAGDVAEPEPVVDVGNTEDASCEAGTSTEPRRWSRVRRTLHKSKKIAAVDCSSDEDGGSLDSVSLSTGKRGNHASRLITLCRKKIKALQNTNPPAGEVQKSIKEEMEECRIELQEVENRLFNRVDSPSTVPNNLQVEQDRGEGELRDSAQLTQDEINRQDTDTTLPVVSSCGILCPFTETQCKDDSSTSSAMYIKSPEVLSKVRGKSQLNMIPDNTTDLKEQLSQTNTHTFPTELLNSDEAESTEEKGDVIYRPQTMPSLRHEDGSSEGTRPTSFWKNCSAKTRKLFRKTMNQQKKKPSPDQKWNNEDANNDPNDVSVINDSGVDVTVPPSEDQELNNDSGIDVRVPSFVENREEPVDMYQRWPPSCRQCLDRRATRGVTDIRFPREQSHQAGTLSMMGCGVRVLKVGSMNQAQGRIIRNLGRKMQLKWKNLLLDMLVFFFCMIFVISLMVVVMVRMQQDKFIMFNELPPM